MARLSARQRASDRSDGNRVNADANPVDTFLAGLAAVAYWVGAAAGRPDARAEARPQAYDAGFLDGIQARDSVDPDDSSS